MTSKRGKRRAQRSWPSTSIQTHHQPRSRVQAFSHRGIVPGCPRQLKLTRCADRWLGSAPAAGQLCPDPRHESDGTRLDEVPVAILTHPIARLVNVATLLPAGTNLLVTDEAVFVIPTARYRHSTVRGIQAPCSSSLARPFPFPLWSRKLRTTSGHRFRFPRSMRYARSRAISSMPQTCSMTFLTACRSAPTPMHPLHHGGSLATRISEMK